MHKPQKKLKMSGLVKRTGVPKSTILYYIKEGLIPKPEKTCLNMAYYDESYIERIQLIKSLQEKKYYPLSVIKDYLKMIDSGGTPELLLEMDQVVFETKEKGEKFYTKKEFYDATGLSESELKKAEEMKIILPLSRPSKKRYDEDDVRMGRIIFGCLRMGIMWDHFSVYIECAEKISDAQISLRNRIVEGQDINTTIDMTTMLTRAAEESRSYIFRRFLQKRAEIERIKEVKKFSGQKTVKA